MEGEKAAEARRKLHAAYRKQDRKKGTGKAPTKMTPAENLETEAVAVLASADGVPPVILSDENAVTQEP